MIFAVALVGIWIRHLFCKWVEPFPSFFVENLSLRHVRMPRELDQRIARILRLHLVETLMLANLAYMQDTVIWT